MSRMPRVPSQGWRGRGYNRHGGILEFVLRQLAALPLWTRRLTAPSVTSRRARGHAR